MNAEQGKIFLNFFVGNLEMECPTTKKVIAAVPNDRKTYRPDEKSKNAHDLAWHIATSDIWFIDSVLKGSFDMTGGEAPAAPATIAEIVTWYEKNYTDRIAKLKAAPLESLTKPVAFFGMMELPVVMYLNFMTHHMAHHRGQLAAYLRAMGGRVPSIYGGSADEPFQAATQS
jgi:uncharacterized damage-inducible protein DinB